MEVYVLTGIDNYSHGRHTIIGVYSNYTALQLGIEQAKETYSCLDWTETTMYTCADFDD